MAQSDLIVAKRISIKNFIGVMALTVVLAIGWLFGGFAWNLHPGIVFLVGFAVLGAGYLYVWLMLISTEYRLFNESLEVESGIISRKIENIQLFRVRDLGLSQSVLGRIFNVGNIAISSTDKTAPLYTLHGVDNPRELYDTVREQVAKSQATRRTMIVEDDQIEQIEGEG